MYRTCYIKDGWYGALCKICVFETQDTVRFVRCIGNMQGETKEPSGKCISWTCYQKCFLYQSKKQEHLNLFFFGAFSTFCLFSIDIICECLRIKHKV